MVMVYINIKAEVVQGIILNMISTLAGFIVTALIFERILNAYNKINELKQIKIVAVHFNNILQQYIDIFADIFKSVSLEAKGHVPEEINVFFNLNFFELIEEFDWNSSSPALYSLDYSKDKGIIYKNMPWHEYLVDRFSKLEFKYDSLFVKYSVWMTEEMLNNYAILIDNELSEKIKKGKKYEDLKLRIAQQTGTSFKLLRFPFVCPLNTVIDAIIKIDNFNRTHFPNINHIKVNTRLWINKTAPSIGSGRISSKDEHKYAPKDLLGILKKQSGPIRLDEL
jgi:hypothetical protein